MVATQLVSSKRPEESGPSDGSGRPGFFIVGAPRCGTTALYRWLREHPRIYLPPVKECHYFASDLEKYRTIRTEKEYLGLFRGVGSHHQAVGEASVMYLSSEVALERLLAFAPAAKVVVTLRNPLEMLPSWHGQLLVTLQEEVADFESAWAMQEERRSGKAIPGTCVVPEALQYAEIGRLGAQVERLLKQCDRQQIHFVVYDDLKRDPCATYDALQKALGVDSDGRSDFGKVNQNREITSPMLRRFWQRSRPIRQRLKVVRRVVGDSFYDRTRDFLLPHLSRPTHREPLSAKMREVLVAEFRDDVLLLSDLIDRDLSHWLTSDSL